MQKDTMAQVFSCEFCEISKSTFLTEHLWTTASDYSLFVDILSVYAEKNFHISQRFHFLPDPEEVVSHPNGKSKGSNFEG